MTGGPCARRAEKKQDVAPHPAVRSRKDGLSDMPDENKPLQEEPDTGEIVRIRREKLRRLQQSGRNPFSITTYDRDALNSQIASRFEQYDGKEVSIAGRMMSRRDMGKANFIDIFDVTGRIQVYVRINDVGEEAFADFKTWDLGDIVGVQGTVFRTRRGEITVRAAHLTLLSKSLLPLPEKWHGLRDTELRYRQRYLDLIMNPDTRDTFLRRSRIISAIRSFLDGRGYSEVETPVLNVIAGGAAARPFITHHNALDIDLYLRIATELYLKRLIVGGMEKVYEIGRVFRNEGIDVRHNPEYTSIELYEAYTDYNGMMRLTEQMVSQVAQQVNGSMTVKYGEDELDLTPPWRRMTMLEAVAHYTGVDFRPLRQDAAGAVAAARALGVEVADSSSWGEAFYAVFDQKVESQLVAPTFILDYPVEVSPLTKCKADCPELTERFEVFAGRMELGNAYSELNDPIDQRERLVRQMQLRNSGVEEADTLDEDFVTAMEYGMPPTGGLGIGIDRLVMLLTDSASIRDVLLFPTMRPLPPQ